MNFSIIILAAGLGTRMNNSDDPKVLTILEGFPLIYYVLRTAISIKPEKICIVVGYQKEKLISYIENEFLKLHPYPNIKFVTQAEQLGTGHAVKCCKDNFTNYAGKILILSGDVPLLSPATLLQFIEDSKGTDLSIMTSIATNPYEYGRVLRDNNEEIIGIIEEKDASELERLIYEVNTGIYFVSSEILFSLLDKVTTSKKTNEYYLTDIVAIGIEEDYQVVANSVANFSEVQGVNTILQLNLIRKILLQELYCPIVK